MLKVDLTNMNGDLYNIYKIEYIDGRCYIGLTSNVLARIRQYRYEYNTDKQIPRNGISSAMKKMGVDEFEFSILYTTDDLDEAMRKEEFYINLYNSTNPDNGFNLSNKSVGGIKLNPRKQSPDEIAARSKKVYLINNGIPIAYPSAKELALHLEVPRTNVTRAAKNGNTVRGRLVVYDDKESLLLAHDKVRDKLLSGKFKKLRDIKDKERFIAYCSLMYDRSVEVIP